MPNKWLFESDKAKEHLKKCKDPFNCDKCHWIDASSGAAEEYGTVIESVYEPHPLTSYIIGKFNGKEDN